MCVCVRACHPYVQDHFNATHGSTGSRHLKTTSAAPFQLSASVQLIGWTSGVQNCRIEWQKFRKEKKIGELRTRRPNLHSPFRVVSGLQKGPAERGHVKKPQKSSKSVKKFFDTFRAGQKTSKIVKKCQKVFRHFSTLFAPFFQPLLQSAEVDQKSGQASDRAQIWVCLVQ